MATEITALGCPRPVGAVCEYPTCVEEGHCEAGSYPGSDKSQIATCDTCQGDRETDRLLPDGSGYVREVCASCGALPCDQTIEDRRPPHPLISDRETRLFRYVTHDDIRRWEKMEFRYNNLVRAMKDAINDEQV